MVKNVICPILRIKLLKYLITYFKGYYILYIFSKILLILKNLPQIIFDLTPKNI